MTALQLQFWSLMAVVALGILNLALIPLIKKAQQGQVSELKEQFEKMIEAHNESKFAHPDMTRAARDEVDRVASNAQAAAAGVATIAREAAAGVAKTAQDAVAKVAADADDAVSRVREGIEKQFEKVHQEVADLRKAITDFREEVAGWKPRLVAKAARGRDA